MNHRQPSIVSSRSLRTSLHSLRSILLHITVVSSILSIHSPSYCQAVPTPQSSNPPSSFSLPSTSSSSSISSLSSSSPLLPDLLAPSPLSKADSSISTSPSPPFFDSPQLDSFPGTVLIPLVPITSHQDPQVIQRFQRFKYDSSTPSSSSSNQRRNDPSSVPVSNVGRVGYAGRVMIGTPPQEFPLLFDTGSDLVLVTAETCIGEECPGLLHFNCRASKTCTDLVPDDRQRTNGRNPVLKPLVTTMGVTSLSTTPTTGDIGIQGVTTTSTAKAGSSGNGGIENGETGRINGPGGSFGTMMMLTNNNNDDNLSNLQGKQDQAVDTTAVPYFQPPSMLFSGGSLPSGYIPSSLSRSGSGPQTLTTSSPSSSSDLATGFGHHQTQPPLTPYYNQSYVDGSWGAGTFVQDVIGIVQPPSPMVYAASVPTTGTTYVPEVGHPNRNIGQDGAVPSIVPSTNNPIASIASIPPQQQQSQPQPPLETRKPNTAMVTFLSVIRDQLDLVHGYDGQISGLLGLSRASPTGRKTFLQELVDQGALAKPVASMQLEIQGGSFLLGGIDTTRYTGEMVYTPVTDPVAWQINLEAMSLYNRSNPGGGVGGVGESFKNLDYPSLFSNTPLILDSGTSSILIPMEASRVLHTELGGYLDPIHQVWFLPCQGSDLVWWIGGQGILQPYSQLIYRLPDGRCQSLIFESQEKYWLLGGSWLRGLYIVYDMAGQGRIGIASAINMFEEVVGTKSTFGQNNNDRAVRILSQRPKNQPSVTTSFAGSTFSVGSIPWFYSPTRPPLPPTTTNPLASISRMSTTVSRIISVVTALIIYLCIIS